VLFQSVPPKLFLKFKVISAAGTGDAVADDADDAATMNANGATAITTSSS
jgi:hypothetical protein